MAELRTRGWLFAKRIFASWEWAITVRAPFVYVAVHVEEAEAVWGFVGSDRGSAIESAVYEVGLTGG